MIPAKTSSPRRAERSSGAALPGSVLPGAVLSGAVLSGAVLSGAFMRCSPRPWYGRPGAGWPAGPPRTPRRRRP
ncbi:pentapeptide repeat-containing protein [Streptomyces erythrochromogenes]|uniref:pentapeptide repeat-containing protein n=1 Tax=Streptomyces erythrochromogenes TaxID=285574 RepID=UPI00342712D5